MAIQLKQNFRTKPVIDLDGPQGNAFALMATATELGKSMGWTALDVATVNKQMMEDDYTHLVKTFLYHFGDLVDITTSDTKLFDDCANTTG